MKKVITPLLRVLIKLFAFIIFVFVVGCEKEEIINILDDSSVNSEGDFNITEVSYEEFKTDSIYHELAVAIESKFNKKEHLISKNDSLLYDYNILTDKVIKVSEANNYVSYTFEILNPNQPKYTFDNYIIRRKGGELIEEYIVRYEYDLLNYIKGDENAYTARAVFDLNYNPIFDKGDKNLSSKIIYSNGCMMNIDMYHYTPERRWFLYTDGSTCHFPGRCEVTLVIDVNCPITSSGGGGAGGGSDPGDPSFPGNPSGGGDPVNQSGVIDTPLGPATALEVESSLAFKIYYLLDRGLNYYRYSWLNSHPVESVQLLKYLTENTNPATLKAYSQAKKFALVAMDTMINGGKVDFENEIIKDSSFIGTKADCVLKELISTGNNLFKKTSEAFTQNNSKYKIKFTTVNKPSATSNATTSLPDSNGIITIAYNIGKYESAIEVASTILHETIHAELHRIKLSNNSEPNSISTIQYNWYIKMWKSYEGLYDNIEEVAAEAEHYYMSAYYINPLAKGLKEYDKNMHPIDNYKYFAWNGLDKYGKDAKYITKDELTRLANLSVIINSDSYSSNCDK
ncbi:hypothetical protein [Galbibacter orientalis]|uniref:hypothetical protein n=1 Tax=Galbibacter orientalis TaxID=453852 RepID=UPI0030804F2C